MKSNLLHDTVTEQATLIVFQREFMYSMDMHQSSRSKKLSGCPSHNFSGEILAGLNKRIIQSQS